MTSDFWDGRRVLITGATGFIGSWLTETLVKRHADVTTLIKKNDPFGIDAIKNIINNVRMIRGDIRNAKSVADAVKNQEVIFHLAAVTQVLYSIKNPVETFNVNVDGASNILEEIRKSNEEQFLVFASTDKVYGEPKYLPIDENHPLSSKSPYDASKLAADRLVNAYHITYNLKTVILRWANTYGGRDANVLRAVPDFITSIINQKPLIIRGNGKHIRDFTYVTDIVNGILLSVEKSNLTNGEVFNFGTERPTSIEELANLIIKLAGYENKLKPIILGKPTPGEINKQYLSYKKAKAILKWEPTVNLEDGLRTTIRWYQENLWWQKVMERVKTSTT